MTPQKSTHERCLIRSLCCVPLCLCVPLCCAVLCRADDEADRQALVWQQNKVAALEAQLATLKVGLSAAPGCQQHSKAGIALGPASMTRICDT